MGVRVPPGRPIARTIMKKIYEPGEIMYLAFYPYSNWKRAPDIKIWQDAEKRLFLYLKDALPVDEQTDDSCGVPIDNT